MCSVSYRGEKIKVSFHTPPVCSFYAKDGNLKLFYIYQLLTLISGKSFVRKTHATNIAVKSGGIEFGFRTGKTDNSFFPVHPFVAGVPPMQRFQSAGQYHASR